MHASKVFKTFLRFPSNIPQSNPSEKATAPKISSEFQFSGVLKILYHNYLDKDDYDDDDDAAAADDDDVEMKI